MATFFGQFKAVMRKNLILKMRNKKQAVQEVLLPIYFIAILTVIKLSVKPEENPQLTNLPEYSLYSGELRHLDPDKLNDWKILVAPDDGHIQDVMNEAAAILQDVFQSNTTHPTIQFFKNQSEAEKAFSSRGDSKVLAGVLFDFTSNATTSYSGGGNLSYALRFGKADIPDTDIKTLYVPQSVCRSDGSNKGLARFNCEVNKYLYSGFSAVQAAIDTAIIRKYGGNANFVHPNISIQMLPKPANQPDSNYIQVISAVYFVIAYSPLISFLATNLVAEKEKKIKEGMRMMGLRSSVFWLSWGVVYGILILIVTAIVTAIAGASKFFAHSNVFLFFLLLVFYGLSIIGLAFLMTPFFNKARVAGTLASFGSILVSLLYLIVSMTRKTSVDGASVSYSISVPVRWILCLLSPVALSLGIDQAIYLDLRGGMDFSTAADGEFPLYAPLGMLVLDSVLYFMLAVYFDNVIPGEYGPRHKPWFIFTKEFWCSGNRKKAMNFDMDGHYVVNKSYGSFISSTQEEADAVEPVPASLADHMAVRISMLCKVFESKKKTVKAVDGLSLDIYEGQITAILGHNGAGKTTLLNILTGLTGPTSGRASVLGLDVSNTNDMELIRQKTGICPQHNILFDDLTCIEHLQLFAGIKGVPENRIEKEVKDALDSVGLADQARVQSSKLSGGQKRKLSVAIAIIGDPKIIFLDEPTAGMDPYSRRHLWSVLKEKKKGRVILLTTHFMDEADILADRKAVVSKGSLRCCGSSLFLKNRFGLGYHLNMVVEPDSDQSKIEELVSGFIPGAEVNRVHGKELDITLPQSGIMNFSALFSALEQKTDGKSKADAMGIKSYGVSMTTLEEVFLKLEEQEEESELEEVVGISEKDKLVNGDRHVNTEKTATPKEVNVDIVNNDPMLNADVVSGNQLFKQRIWALCKIRFLRHLRSPMGTIFQVFIPVVLVIVGLVLSKTLGQGESSATSVPVQITPGYYANLTNISAQRSMFGPMPDLLVEDSANNTASSIYIQSLSAVFGIDTYDSSYFTDDVKLLQRGVSPHYLGMDLKHLDASFNSTYKAMYNDSAVHAIPAIVNLMSNGLMAAVTGAADNIINVFSYPWPQSTKNRGWDNAAFTSTLIIAMAFVLIPGGFGIDVVRDREEKIRSQLRISGLPFSVYWLGFFIVESLKYLIPAILLIIVVYIVQVESLMPGGAMFSFILTCITYMPANVLFAYIFSFLFDKWETAQAAMPMLFFMVGYLPYLPVSIVDLVTSADAAAYIHIVCCILDPAYVIFGSIYYTDRVYRMAKWRGMEDQIEFGDYFKFDNYIVICYLMSAIHCVVFVFLLRVLDIRATGGDIRDACFCGDSRSNSVIPHHNTDVIHQEDIDVADERARVKAIQESAAGQIPVALCENLRKEFTKNATFCGCCDKDKCKKGGNLDDKIKVAARNVTFAVDAGEVFGLLGPNGAGKTTTLNMMTADVHPDKGTVIVGGYDVRSSLSKAFQAMGYCPQHDALWDTITLKEHLECYALVRGIPKEKVNDVISFFIDNLKLEEHSNKHSKKLSGGTKRKLSYCMSMLGKPSIVLLDEPSTGMDPQSKRFLWDTISSSFENTDRGAILTTHYMEEADALCSRIAIMVNGKVECLGSSQHLKNKYGSGYLLEVKLATKEQGDTIDERLDKLHQYIINMFPAASVMEQFSERVQYKVPKSSVTSLARAFTVLEEGKSSHDIEEYSFSQSTLEQVFLEFAKRQLEEGQSEKEVELERQLSRALSVEGKHEKETGSYRL